MNGNNPLRRQLPYTQFNATLYLIIANLIVFLVINLSNDLIPMLSMVPALVNRGYVYQFITYMFTHASLNHLVFNMLGLFIFGSQVEQEMGSWEFLLFYFVTGIFAGILSYAIYLLTGSLLVFLLGASGALYAVMLAFATFYPNARIFVLGLLPVRSVTLILVYAGIALYSQFTGSNGGVAHVTHLGGFVFAFLYFIIRFGRNPIDSWRGTY